MHDAVATGCGIVAANGMGREPFGKALAEGHSGIGDILSFDASDLGRERAGEIVDFDADEFLRSPKNYLDRNSALAFAACEMAMRESGLAPAEAMPERGLCLGSMAGNVETLGLFHSTVREKGPRFAPPFLFPHTYYNTTAGLLSIEYGLGGVHEQFCSGSVAGLEAIASGAHHIEEGRAGMVVAGGVEAFAEPLFRVAAGRGWLSPSNGRDECCRPFDRKRNGSILGEGAALFVLESAQSARSRGARIIACMRAAAISASPRAAMADALARAKIEAASVDVLFASAGGYVREDEEEALAIADLFGEKAVPVVALKAFTGETLGASGALNVAGGVVALEKGLLPAVPGGACAFEGLRLVRRAERADVRTVLVNAGSPGQGRWVSLVLSGGEA